MAEHKEQAPKSIITVDLNKLASEFDPFYNRIKSIDRTGEAFMIFSKSYSLYRRKMKLSDSIFGTLSNELIKVREEPGNIRRITYLHPFYYLGYVESIGNTMTNMIIMTLISAGHDFHVVESKWEVNHIKSIKELDKRNISLTSKLRFLENNNIKEFSAAVDSSLRNDIAHLNFHLRDGVICIRGKLAAPEIGKATANLFWALLGMGQIIDKLAEDTGLIDLTQ